MKTFLGAMLSLLVVISAINFSSAKTNKILDNMNSRIDEVIYFANTEEWQSCNSVFSNFNSQWQKDKTRFAVVVHGDKIFSINEVLKEIETFIFYENTEQTVARAKVLKNHLKSISDNEKLNLENLL